MDTGLRVFRLCLLWGDVADGGVDAPPIVIAFDIGEQVAPCGIAIGVTGGASGIGEATVRRFVGEGASVAFCDRDGERGQRVAAELETAGAKVAFTQADVGTEAACLDFVNGAVQNFGRLDIRCRASG